MEKQTYTSKNSHLFGTEQMLVEVKRDCIKDKGIPNDHSHVFALDLDEYFESQIEFHKKNFNHEFRKEDWTVTNLQKQTYFQC